MEDREIQAQPGSEAETIRQKIRLGPALHAAADAALALLYPTMCRVCGRAVESRHDGVVCATCWAKLEPPPFHCEKCDVAVSRPRMTDGAICCGLCDEFAFEYARCSGPYQGPLREIVLWLKSHPHLPVRVRNLLFETFCRLPDHESIDAILPVPLHPERMKERGFNQAEIIAEALAASTGRRLDRVSLHRIKPTERHRAGMGANQRARSLENAFSARESRLIRDRRLLVVDDIMTTGSTANEIAKTLLASGAKSVNMLTLARAKGEFLLS
jgi:ComF family protein